MTKTIAIIAEHDTETIKPATWELLAFAKRLQELQKADICFYIIGKDTKTLAEHISSQTGCPAIAADALKTASYHGEIHKNTLAHLFEKHPSDYIIASHNTSGMDYAPALSIALKGSCITSVENIKRENTGLCFIRAMFNGKIQANLSSPKTSKASPLILTVQPGAFKPLKEDKKITPNVTHETFEYLENKMTYKRQLPSPSQGSNLAKAEVIVSGGRGIEEEENYQFIEMLADVFPRSATGASRPICDYGWVKYSKQVGATGTIVSPKIYIACGISGSTQHLEGIRDSRFIIAINSDPAAPIFQVADVCIEEDLTEFIPIFIEVLQKRKRPAN